MKISELERVKEQLDTKKTSSLVERALQTYQLLRALRVLIDAADDQLIELSQQRDSALIALGESALADLQSATPTLDRAEFAETLDVLRRDLEALTGDAAIAREAYETKQRALDNERAILNADVARLDDEILMLENLLRDLPDELEERDPEIEMIAERMVNLRDELAAAEMRLNLHESQAERTLARLAQTSQIRQQAVEHVDGRVHTVIRDLGRSVLDLSHEIAQSDPAARVRETRGNMRELRHRRRRAVALMEQVNTRPIMYVLGGCGATMAALVALGFWLF